MCNTNHSLKNDPTLKNYVSKSGLYLIPIEWAVYSTITVRANNLAEAIAKAEAQFDDIPCQTENEYIDGSMRISINEAEDAIMAQGYQTIGDTVLE